LSEFKKATQASDDATKATAHLPGLDIEIVHRRSPDGGSEQLSINLQAVPSFEAFGRFLETANPFALWADTAWLTWFSWLEARRAAMPWSFVPLLLKTGSEAVSASPKERHSSG